MTLGETALTALLSPQLESPLPTTGLYRHFAPVKDRRDRWGRIRQVLLCAEVQKRPHRCLLLGKKALPCLSVEFYASVYPSHLASFICSLSRTP